MFASVLPTEYTPGNVLLDSHVVWCDVQIQKDVLRDVLCLDV